LADFGIGIPKSVRNYGRDLNDNNAIQLAATDGFTTQSIPGNRGAGLSYLIDNIVKNFCGKVTIRSLNGYVEFKNSTGSVKQSSHENCGYCIGTTIDIVLNTNNLVDDTIIEEELEW